MHPDLVFVCTIESWDFSRVNWGENFFLVVLGVDFGLFSYSTNGQFFIVAISRDDHKSLGETFSAFGIPLLNFFSPLSL